VHLYSNPPVGVETLQTLLIMAKSATPRHEEAPTRQKQVRLDPGQVMKLATAYREGKTIKELALLFGIHRTTVMTLLERKSPRRQQRN
jgi:DNA-directed RNA polymerase specialized sigma24 family protein